MPGCLGDDRDLHLHRLQQDDGVAGLDRVPLGRRRRSSRWPPSPPRSRSPAFAGHGGDPIRYRRVRRSRARRAVAGSGLRAGPRCAAARAGRIAVASSARRAPRPREPVSARSSRIDDVARSPGRRPGRRPRRGRTRAAASAGLISELATAGRCRRHRRRRPTSPAGAGRACGTPQASAGTPSTASIGRGKAPRLVAAPADAVQQRSRPGRACRSGAAARRTRSGDGQRRRRRSATTDQAAAARGRASRRRAGRRGRARRTSAAARVTYSKRHQGDQRLEADDRERADGGDHERRGAPRATRPGSGRPGTVDHHRQHGRRRRRSSPPPRCAGTASSAAPPRRRRAPARAAPKTTGRPPVRAASAQAYAVTIATAPDAVEPRRAADQRATRRPGRPQRRPGRRAPRSERVRADVDAIRRRRTGTDARGWSRLVGATRGPRAGAAAGAGRRGVRASGRLRRRGGGLGHGRARLQPAVGQRRVGRRAPRRGLRGRASPRSTAGPSPASTSTSPSGSTTIECPV